jgi:hypothetical protein
MGVSTRSVQSYEAGTIIPFRHLHRISAATGKPPSWLLDGSAHRAVTIREGLVAVNRELLERLRVQEELLASLSHELAQLRTLRAEVDRLRAELRSARRSGASATGEEQPGSSSAISRKNLEQ